MNLSIFLPIFKVQIEFQVKHGRPWTSLEHLVLWAIVEKRRTVDELAVGASTPPRMIIECLINLMRAGWIEVHSSSSVIYFAITDAGQRAARDKELRYDFHFSRRFRTFYVERVTDTVLKTDGIRVLHYLKAAESAEQQGGLIMEPSIYKAMLKPHDIMDQLTLDADDQFEAWLDHRVLGANLYAILRLRNGKLEGLPESIDPNLIDAVTKAAKEHQKSQGVVAEDENGAKAPRLSEAKRFRRCQFSTSDIVVGGEAHLSEMQRMLRTAESYVTIHSTFMGRAALDLISDDIEASAKRGVEIDLLWGERDKLSQGARNESAIEARKLEERFKGLQNKIRIGSAPTGSHCKLILADSGENKSFEAVVGSCNWLSSAYKAVDISARLKDPQLVRDVAHTFASLQMPSSGRWDRGVMRAVRIAEECRLAPRASASDAGAMLVLDEDHYAAVRDARDNATQCILAGCDWLGTAAETSVFVPVRSASDAGNLEIRLLYQRLDKRVEGKIDAIRAELGGKGIELVEAAGLHGKYLIWDADTVVLGSFNWLSTAPHAYSTGPSEVGILIEMPGVGARLRAELNAIKCPA